MKKFMALIMATVMCTAVLTACGSTASDNGEKSEAAVSAEATSSADNAMGKDVLVFGTNAEFPPL